jgi:hypothetical protein
MEKLKLLETIKELLIMPRRIKFLQADYTLIVSMLFLKPLAIPLAENQTLGFHFLNFSLRVALMHKRLNDFISLAFREIKINRLQYRLQSSQFSTLISLQVQAVSSTNCKEKFTEDQNIYKILFAHLFAKNSN